MSVIKAVQLRQNLKEVLEKVYNGEEKDLFLDYYGKLFKIIPISKDKFEKGVKKTQAQMVIEHFKNLPPKKLTNPIFNEDDPAQEKENFRNLIYKRYEK